MSRPRKIVITTGDTDGIGLEVTAKALEKIGPQRGFQFIYVRGSKAAPSLLKRIGRKFKVRSFQTWHEALEYVPSSHKELVEAVLPQSPARWVENAAVAALHRKIDALVTGPLSKPEIKNAGLHDLGHTEILKRLSKSPDLWMTFFGKRFHVFLLSGHMPVKEIEAALTPEKIERGLREALRLYKPSVKKPLAVLGLNPHAGDRGLLGSFDDEILAPVINRLREEGHAISGPLVPDAAFHEIGRAHV